ncbi:VWA domain-containing protein [Rhodococcus sp. NPDC058532]|uniref:vWA domain-containing protein n=1 Tax=Rhodococcus sp. NPDC058532 TaxID=3346540 RepID=UPI00365D65C9
MGLAVGLIGATIVATPAAAQGAGDAASYAPTMLILDASGSMQRPDQAGTMMDAAKNAVHAFVDTAPAASRVGLAVYGTGTGNGESEKVAGCRDVRVVQRPDPLDRAALNDAVDGITASGWTPMGTALRAAAQALPDSGPRSIVLVSDGDDTCAPPEPCEVARELKSQGVDLVMHAIGFAVDETARAQLTCMAQATGGTYTDAADGAALARTLPRVTAAALRNYEAAGTPVTGTPGHQAAPVLTPGQHLDTIGQKQERYYAVDVPDGATAYFSATVSFPAAPQRRVQSNRDNNVLQLRVYGRDGQDCNEFEFEQVTDTSGGAALTVAAAFDGASEKPTGDNAGADRCRGGGRYYVATTWSTVSDGVPDRIPVELLVGIEPAATDPGPAGATTPTAFVEPSGSGTPTVGGGSFNVATELAGSGRYTDTVRRGEIVYYRVALDWGQGLAYRVHLAGNGSTAVEDVSLARSTLYSPSREEMVSDFGSYTGSDQVLPSGDTALASTAVRYQNRGSDDLAVRTTAVPGSYYIAVKVGATSVAGAGVPVPIRLDLTVTGEPEDGPGYATGVPAGIFGERPVPDTAAVPVTAAAEQGAAPAAEHAPASGSSTVAIGIAAAAAAVALGGLALGWVVLRRRRR